MVGALKQDGTQLQRSVKDPGEDGHQQISTGSQTGGGAHPQDLCGHPTLKERTHILLTDLQCTVRMQVVLLC